MASTSVNQFNYSTDLLDSTYMKDGWTVMIHHQY